MGHASIEMLTKCEAHSTDPEPDLDLPTIGCTHLTLIEPCNCKAVWDRVTRCAVRFTPCDRHLRASDVAGINAGSVRWAVPDHYHRVRHRRPL